MRNPARDAILRLGATVRCPQCGQEVTPILVRPGGWKLRFHDAVGQFDVEEAWFLGRKGPIHSARPAVCPGSGTEPVL